MIGFPLNTVALFSYLPFASKVSPSLDGVSVNPAAAAALFGLCQQEGHVTEIRRRLLKASRYSS